MLEDDAELKGESSDAGLSLLRLAFVGMALASTYEVSRLESWSLRSLLTILKALRQSCSVSPELGCYMNVPIQLATKT
jgi:hypothetical protein